MNLIVVVRVDGFRQFIKVRPRMDLLFILQMKNEYREPRSNGTDSGILNPLRPSGNYVNHLL
jgi:hypothetical protein